MTDTRPQLLILSYSQIHRDARLLRQIRLFAPHYEIITCGYGPTPELVAEHVEIPADVSSWRTDRRLVVARQFRRAFNSAPVTRAVRELLVGREFDVVLVNDVYPVPIAVELGARGGVHSDLHEYATRQQEEVWRFRYFLAPYIGYLIRKYVTKADSVTTVGHALAAEYKREFGLDAGVVYNAPARADLPAGEAHDPPRLVHAGGATPARLETMLAAMELTTSQATLDLYLVDSGGGYAAQVRQRYADHPRIHVHDAVPTDQLVATLNHYDVGVHILPPVSFNHKYAMPNKLFDYIQARLGVLIGPSPEMAEVVRRYELGWVSDDFTPEAVARTIDGLDVAGIRAAKQQSAVAAQELCAEEQVNGWARPVAELAKRAGFDVPVAEPNP